MTMGTTLIQYPEPLERPLGVAVSLARLYLIEKKRVKDLEELDQAILQYKSHRKTFNQQ